MAACFYIVVEGEDPGFDTFVDGHALARHEAELEHLAASLDVTPLLEFFSADRNSMAMLLEQGAGDPAWTQSLPEPQWFLPHEGLQTIDALLNHIENDRSGFGSSYTALVRELRQYSLVLNKSAGRGLRWHLAVSWE